MTRRHAPEEYGDAGPLFERDKPEHVIPLADLGLDDASLRAAFERYHAENPHVWALFERFALEAIARGRGRFGAKAIFERMRWYAAFETEGDGFKINNNYTAYYARMFESRHPEHAGFFEMREVGRS